MGEKAINYGNKIVLLFLVIGLENSEKNKNSYIVTSASSKKKNLRLVSEHQHRGNTAILVTDTGTESPASGRDGSHSISSSLCQ